jgi:hypothetical protein
MKEFAQILIKSNLAPKSFNTPEQIIVALVTGSELGISAMQSLQGLSVVQGKIGIMGDLALALCKASGLVEGEKTEYEGEGDQLSCRFSIKRKGSDWEVETFSVGDAKLAGIYERSPVWKAYPKRMTYYRALGFALRDAFPDVLKGIKTVEELKDYPEEAHEGFEHAKPVTDARVTHVANNGNGTHEEPSKENGFGHGKSSTLEGIVERAWPNDYQGKRYYFAKVNGQQVQTTDDEPGEELLTLTGRIVKLEVEQSPKGPGKFYLKRVLSNEPPVAKEVAVEQIQTAKQAVRETPSAHIVEKNYATEKESLFKQIGDKMKEAKVSHAQVLEAAKTFQYAGDEETSLRNVDEANLKNILSWWPQIQGEARGVKPEAVA